MTAAFRCAVVSAALDEPLAGTASTVRAFLLVECGGPWGIDAVRDCRLPDPVKKHLLDLESQHRIRPLLVRRPGRSGGGRVRIFASYVDHRSPWVQSTELDDPHDLMDLELSGLGEGRSVGLEPHTDLLYLVCTHGRHDACCAERGRPLAAALAGRAAEQTWEVSHIGGDRFAGNVLVLPHGLYYGRLGPADAGAFLARHSDGELDLEHLRGRSSYPFAVQAAEVFLRRHLDRHGVAALAVDRVDRDGVDTRVRFVVDAALWEVAVRTELVPDRQLTCRATRGSTARSHRLLGFAEV